MNRRCLILPVAYILASVVFAQNSYSPEFPNRPYYIDGDKLVDFERSNAEATKMKLKALGYGGYEMLITVPNATSTVRFKTTDSLKFVIKLAESIDPADVVFIQKGVSHKKDRLFKTIVNHSAFAKDEGVATLSPVFEKLEPGKYLARVNTALPPGEYIIMIGYKSENVITPGLNGAKNSYFGID